MSKKITVFYHGRCNDGMAAAVLTYMSLGDKATYVPYFHNKRPDIPTEGDVWFVDCCPTPETLNDLISLVVGNGNQVMIFDHHVSAMEEIAPILKEHESELLNYTYKKDACGAKIMYDVLGVDKDDKLKDFIELIDIRDRWVEDGKFSKRTADALATSLFALDWSTMEVPAAHKTMLKVVDNMKQEIEIGLGVICYIDGLVENNIQSATVIDTPNYVLGIANSYTAISETGSHFCNYVMAGKPAVYVGYKYQPSDPATNNGPTYELSLRSNKEGNALALVEYIKANDYALSGGGHKEACGCAMKANISIDRLNTILAMAMRETH